MIHAVVAGCGHYLPERVVTNHDLDPALGTNDAWIRERTGITERRIAGEGETTSVLAVHAARAALENAGMKPSEIDMIVLATATPDLTFPGSATLVQAALGTSGGAMDVNAACAGFVYAMMTADGLIKNGTAKNILVIGAETMSRVVDWTDRGTCILFGDGAGALVLRAEEQADDAPRGLLAGELVSDGSLAPLLRTDGGISSTQTAGVLSMQGKEVFRHAVARMSESSARIAAKAGFAVAAIDWIVPHQANARILSACATKLGVPEEKMIMSLDRHANTSAASIPLALSEASGDGRITRGQLVLLTALGAGLTWGSCIIRW